MKDLKVLKTTSSDISRYCSDVASIGDFMYSRDRPKRPGDINLRPFDMRRVDDRLVGVAINNMVKLDLTMFHLRDSQQQAGSKLPIMLEGDLLFWMKPRKIPMGQPLYVSHKGKPTWRKIGPKFGYAITHQDKDGFLKVHVNLISGG